MALSSDLLADEFKCFAPAIRITWHCVVLYKARSTLQTLEYRAIFDLINFTKVACSNTNAKQAYIVECIVRVQNNHVWLELGVQGVEGQD